MLTNCLFFSNVSRDVCQRGSPLVVSTQDPAVQERKRAELPHEFQGRSGLLRAHSPPPARSHRLRQTQQRRPHQESQSGFRHCREAFGYT